MSTDVGRRRGSDPALLWLWCRQVATAPIRSLAWEPPYAVGAAQEMAKRQKKSKIILTVVSSKFLSCPERNSTFVCTAQEEEKGTDQE